MQQVVEQLGLGAKMPARKGGPGQPGPAQMPSPGGRFVLPISDCEFTVNAALDELQHNAFPTISEQRPSRCTGTALQVGRLIRPPALPACSACRLLSGKDTLMCTATHAPNPRTASTAGCLPLPFMPHMAVGC